MKRDRWDIVWDLFSAAADLPAAQRSAFLLSAPVDSDVRDEVMALLEASIACTVSRSRPLPGPASPEYPPGQEFGRYVIVGAVGEGGFGRIYAAHDRELRRVVALKVLSGHLPAGVEPLIDEARAASALNHPNIVMIHETISIDGHLAIVMEFVDGRSLRQILRDAGGPLPAATVLRYGRQISEALQAAHQAGIAHGDVKPENILVRKDEYVKLADFGLAADAKAGSPSSSPPGGLAGTLRYISPEQLRGEPGSAASDIFSLGLVLYEMTAGVHAFQGATPLEIAEAIATQQPLPISRRGLDPLRELDRLVASMLSKNPEARPSAGDVAAALDRVASRSGGRWRRTGVWAAGTAAALAAGAFLFLSGVWNRSPRPVTLRLETKPLTGDAGREASPALSPDGLSVVYTWQEKAGAQPITLVRDINSARKVVLPITGGFAWTPDSRRIGFVRRNSDEQTLCTIAKDGSGAIQEVFRARSIGDFEWTPDGESVVHSSLDPKTGSVILVLHSIRSGQSRVLTPPPEHSLGVEQFAIAPDGGRLAFRRLSSYGNSDVFVIRLPAAGREKQVTSHQSPGHAIAWIADGSSIISSTMRGPNYSLWLHPIASPDKFVRLTEIGIDALSIRSARDRNRLVWVNLLEDTNIWSVPVRGGGQPERVISSAMRDLDIASSPTGLLSFRSDRSGFPEIWISAGDGGSQKKVTDLRGFTGSPAWAPDGRHIAFDSRRPNAASDIYLLECDPARIECSTPMQVTDHAASDALPSWSADGKQLYFASMRSGQWEVWKTAVNRNRPSAPLQVTTAGGFLAAESPDQKWLYYSRVRSEAVMGVWRKRLQAPGPAGDAGEMVLPLEFRATATWRVANGEIYYPAYRAGQSGVWAFNLQTRQKRLLYDGGTMPLSRGLTVSLAGKAVLFARVDRSESNIMVADYDIVK